MIVPLDLPHNSIALSMERDIAQIGGTTLITNKPLFVGKLVVQDLESVTNVFHISSMSLRVGRERRTTPMEDLLQHRPLCGCLELQPLLHEVSLLEIREGNAVVFVVLLDHIVHNGAGP